MTDNVVNFPSAIKASTPAKEAYPLADMIDCLEAMRELLLDPSHKVEGIAISIVTRADDKQSSYSAYCSNNVSSTLGGLVMLQKRILEEAT